LTADLHELTSRVRAFADARDWGQFHSPRNLAMAVSVESAELLELYLWEDPPPNKRSRVEDEAADVLICLLNFCDRAGIDLPAAFDRKLAAAERKYPVDRVKGQAKKYDEYADWKPEEE
jgi:dCTP diphosphatase